MIRGKLYQRDKRTQGSKAVKFFFSQNWNSRFLLLSQHEVSQHEGILKRMTDRQTLGLTYQDVKKSDRQAEPGVLGLVALAIIALPFCTIIFLLASSSMGEQLMRSNPIYHLLESLQASICEPLTCTSELTFFSNHNRLVLLFFLMLEHCEFSHFKFFWESSENKAGTILKLKEDSRRKKLHDLYNRELLGGNHPCSWNY